MLKSLLPLLTVNFAAKSRSFFAFLVEHLLSFYKFLPHLLEAALDVEDDCLRLLVTLLEPELASQGELLSSLAIKLTLARQLCPLIGSAEGKRPSVEIGWLKSHRRMF